MKAVFRTRYGPADVLEVKEVPCRADGNEFGEGAPAAPATPA
jgi:hypothetical protein